MLVAFGLLLFMCVEHTQNLDLPSFTTNYIEVFFDEGQVVPNKYMVKTDGEWRAQLQMPQGDIRGQLPSKSKTKLQALAATIRTRHMDFFDLSTAPIKCGMTHGRQSSLFAAVAFCKVMGNVTQTTQVFSPNVLDADYQCPKRDEYVKLAKHYTPGYRTMLNDSNFVAFLENLESYAGGFDEVTPDNWVELLAIVSAEDWSFPSPRSHALLTQAEPYLKKVGLINQGVFSTPIVWNGTQLGAEIQKSRIARLIASLHERVSSRKNNPGRNEKLLANAVSSSTIQALLVAFNKPDEIKSWLPTAGAAVIFEFSGGDFTYFKILYTVDGTNLVDLTDAFKKICFEHCRTNLTFIEMAKDYSDPFQCHVTDYKLYAIPPEELPQIPTTTRQPVPCKFNEDEMWAKALSTCSSNGWIWSTIILSVLLIIAVIVAIVLCVTRPSSIPQPKPLPIRKASELKSEADKWITTKIELEAMGMVVDDEGHIKVQNKKPEEKRDEAKGDASKNEDGKSGKKAKKSDGEALKKDDEKIERKTAKGDVEAGDSGSEQEDGGNRRKIRIGPWEWSWR